MPEFPLLPIYCGKNISIRQIAKTLGVADKHFGTFLKQSNELARTFDFNSVQLSNSSGATTDLNCPEKADK